MLVSHIYTTIANKKSVARIQAALEPFQSPNEKRTASVTIHLSESTAAVVQKSDIVVVAVPHDICIRVLSHPPVRATLLSDDRQRTLISVAGGVSTADLYVAIYGAHHEACPNHAPTREDPCTIVAAIPNIAASLCKSMTVIALPTNLKESGIARTAFQDTQKLFKLIGEVKCLRETQLARAAAVASASLAFWAKAVEAVAQGASRDTDGNEGGPSQAQGAAEEGDGKTESEAKAGASSNETPDESFLLDHADAVEIAAQAMRGAAELLVAGQLTTQGLIEQVATKGGSTARGLEVLNVMHVDGAYQDAVRTAAGASRST